MTFEVFGDNLFCRAFYLVSTDDGINFHCILKHYEGRTCYDKPAEELVLFKCRGRWKSDRKSFKELTLSLGASIDQYLMFQKNIGKDK